MTLRVLDPGLYTLRVDFGRPTARSLGMPVGGAADRCALTVGNALVGNVPNAVALEITLIGPTLQAEDDAACIVFGAPFQLSSGRRDLQPGATFTLGGGEVLRIGGTPTGARAYLCIRGGFAGPTILGSRSALAPIVAGEALVCPPSTLPTRFLSPGLMHPLEPRTLRVLDGAQAAWFNADEFYAHEFMLTPQSNRMGLRLQGQALRLPERELVSEPVCPGAVQVTRDGQCIVLGVDGQTIGGYPKIAQVISADLDKVGQLRPGERLRFLRVTLAEAEARFHQRQAALQQWLTRLGAAETFFPKGRAGK